MTQQPVVVQTPLIIGASQSHSGTHSVELLWTSVQQDAQTSENTQHLQVADIQAPTELEPAIPASMWPQIQALAPRSLGQAMIVRYGA
jgi:hypothetical protein